MENSLSNNEKVILETAGWQFLNENYIFIPDDYDGCMAFGIRHIRRILEGILRKDPVQEIEDSFHRTKGLKGSPAKMTEEQRKRIESILGSEKEDPNIN